MFLRDPGTVWPLYQIGGYIPLNYVIDTAGVVVYGAEGFNETVLRAYIEANLPPTGINESTNSSAFSVSAIRPNPTDRPIVIRFMSIKSSNVVARVYSASGQLVRTISADASTSTLYWNLQDSHGVNVANGLYFCELSNGSNSARIRIAVVR